MTIGEALKEEQKVLGLTSEEMAAGVVSKSTYSKVVNGKSRLSSEYLFKILIAHNIDINEFFEKIKNTYIPKNKLRENELSAEMGIAFNNHDISKAKSCLKKIQQLSTNKYLEWRAQIAVAMLTNTVDKLSDDFKDRIINEFNKQENWIKNGEALKLFSNVMIILPFEEVEMEMKLFFLKISKCLDLSENMKERYAILCCNYLVWRYKFFSVESKTNNIRNTLNYLNNLPNMTKFETYKVIGNYFEKVFSGKLTQAKKIRTELLNLGFKSGISNLPI